MNPECLHIGGLTIHWYGVFMALGFFAGLSNWVALGRSRGGTPHSARTFCSG